MKTFYRTLLTTIFISFSLVSCGGGSADDDGDATRISFTSSNTRLIKQDETIVITFNESIDTTNFTLSGSLIEHSNGGVWSQTNEIDDTFTLTPQTTWPVETNLTAMVTVRDIAGNKVTDIRYSFDVVQDILFYVSNSAVDDSGNGLTPATAKKTIMGAINAATNPATVIVSQGSYTVTDTDNSLIVLKEGVSLYGSYSSDFTARDLKNSVSTISSVSVAYGNIYSPNPVVRAEGDITLATRIDGFTINATTTSIGYTAAMRNVSSSPSVQNNTLNGGSGSFSYAMYNTSNSSPTVQNNTLNGGSETTRSYAMYNTSNSSPTVQNNTINGGSGGSYSYAMVNIDSSPTVQNNTLNGGSGDTQSYAMYNRSNSSPTVQNNTINGGSGGSSSHAMRNISSSSPIVQNNTLNGGSGGAYSYAMSNTTSSPIVQNNTLNGGSGGLHSYAMYDDLSSSSVQNNTLNGGSGTNVSYAMTNNASSTSVQNNTLDGGSGSTAYAMYIFNDSQPIVENNLLLTRTGTDSYCFYENGDDSDPQQFRNNNFSGCDVLYFNFFGVDSISITDATQIDATVQVTNGTVDPADNIFASGNVGVDPMFVDAANGDYHLTVNTPTAITEGGLNGFDDVAYDTSSDEAKADKDGVARPASGTPWAIGAYEP